MAWSFIRLVKDCGWVILLWKILVILRCNDSFLILCNVATASIKIYALKIHNWDKNQPCIYIHHSKENRTFSTTCLTIAVILLHFDKSGKPNVKNMPTLLWCEFRRVDLKGRAKQLFWILKMGNCRFHQTQRRVRSEYKRVAKLLIKSALFHLW